MRSTSPLTPYLPLRPCPGSGKVMHALTADGTTANGNNPPEGALVAMRTGFASALREATGEYMDMELQSANRSRML